MRKAIIAPALALFVTAAVSASPPGAATQAQSLGTSVPVKASVSAQCSVATSPIGFTLGIGYVQAPGHSTYRQSALTLHCTKGASVAVGLNRGLYGGSTAAQFGSRSMKLTASSSYLGYELCHDSACASVWNPSGYTYVSPTDAGSTVPVWARIITGQRVFLGSYSDSVTATLNF